MEGPAIATATGLGGGILRDTLLGELPPVLLRDQLYLAMPLLGSALVLVGHHVVERLRRRLGGTNREAAGLAPGRRLADQ